MKKSIKNESGLKPRNSLTFIISVLRLGLKSGKLQWALALTTQMVLLFFIPGITHTQNQNLAFWKDIQSFKKQDSINPVSKNTILFIGSSSFTNWKDVQDYFPGHTIINRGFGGSSLVDVIRYADDIIFPYQPKQIVIYCGENDLAASDSITAKMVCKRFTTLFELIRKKLPAAAIVFISLKPSPSRWHLKQKVISANAAIKNFLAKEKNTAFVNVYDKMLGTDGTPIKEIFVKDSLHMNSRGYAIWQKEIMPVLKN